MEGGQEEVRAPKLAGVTGAHRVETTRRSPLVQFLKWALPVSAGLMALLLFLWPVVQNQLIAEVSEPITVTEEEAIRAETENRLVDAVFSSVTEGGMPFNIRAEEAIQKMGADDHMDLVRPFAVLDLGDEGKVEVESPAGTFLQEQGRLTLTGGVVITRSDGTRLTTQAANADFEAGTAESVHPVTIDGPDGRIDAQGMQITKAGDHIEFKGPARLEMIMGDGLSPLGQGG